MYKSPSLFILALVILLSACRPDSGPIANNTDVLAMLPADVMSVTRINVPDLMKKADFESFKQKESYQRLVTKTKEENPFLAGVLKDPAKSGVDLDQPVFLVNGMQDGKINRQYNGMIASLNSPGQFQTMMDEMSNKPIKETNGLSIIKSNNGSVLWSDQHVFLSFNSKRIFEGIVIEGMQGELAENANDNSSLKKTLTKDHDIVSWASSNAYAENKDAKMVLVAAGVDPDALKGNFIYSYLDFEDGEIIGHSEFDLQKELTKDLNLFFKNKVKTDFSKYVPAKDLSMVLTAGLDANGMNQVLSERPQTKRFLTRGLNELDLTISDLANIFPGDLCMAFYNMGDGDRNPYPLFLVPTEDEAGLLKLMDKGVDYGLFSKKSKGRYILDSELSDAFAKNLNRGIQEADIQIVISNELMAISSDLDLLDQIDNGGIKKSARLSKEQSKLLSQNIFGGIVNFDELKLKNVKKSFPFSDIQFSTQREFGDLKMNFKNKNDNSLELLLDYLNDLYLDEEKNWNVEI